MKYKYVQIQCLKKINYKFSPRISEKKKVFKCIHLHHFFKILIQDFNIYQRDVYLPEKFNI